MTEAQRNLWNAVCTGNYPPHTTAQDLAAIIDSEENTALHIAAQSGHFPPKTTIQDLTKATND